jgi:hypothetical protein
MNMKLNSRILAALLFLFAALPAAAHDQHTLDQQAFQSLRGHGTFNAVFVVILVILAGLFIFLWRLDRKVSKLEKDIKR